MLRCWYFLTPVRAKSDNPGARKRSRIAGAGQGKLTPVIDHGRLLGKWANFTYKVAGIPTGWVMIEYTVCNDDGEPLPRFANDVKLAKVYRHRAAAAANAAAPKDAPNAAAPEAVANAAVLAASTNAAAPEGARHDDPATAPGVRAALAEASSSAAKGKWKAADGPEASVADVRVASAEHAEAPAVGLCPSCALRLATNATKAKGTASNQGTDAAKAKGIVRADASSA